MRKGLVIFISILFLQCIAFAQNANPNGRVSFVRGFSPTEYKGVAQNWDIIQNEDNFIIFANNTGINLFDGTEWHKAELSQKQPVRCFTKDKDGNIYVGGDNEYGKLYFDRKGEFSYQNLTDSTLTFEKIWKAYYAYDQINFITGKSIISIKEDSVVSNIKPPKNTTIDKSIQMDDNIICYLIDKNDTTKYCTIFDGQSFKKIENSNLFLPKGFYKVNAQKYCVNNYGEIREIIETNGTFKFITINKQFVGSNGEDLGRLDINSVSVGKNMIAVGTHGRGIFLFDFQGRLIRNINKVDGLENQQVRKLHFDQYNNLWSANDNGIYLIDLSNPVTYFNSEDGITSTIEDLYFTKENKALVATHIDLFSDKITENRKHFKDLQLFSMDIFQIKAFTFSDGSERIIIIANNGVYELNQGKKIPISGMYAWDLFQSKVNPDRIWVGLDGDGVGSLLYDPVSKKVKLETYNYANTGGEVRRVIEHDNEVLFTVKNGGIAILDTTQDEMDFVSEGLIDYGSDSKYLQYNLCLFNDQVLVGTDNGIYIKEGRKLIPFSERYNTTHFNEKDLYIHRFYNDNNEKLWLVTFHNSGRDNEFLEIGYIEFNGNDVNFITKPFTAINETVHAIKKDNKGQYWFGGLKRLFVYNPSVNIHQFDSAQCYISGINLKNDTLSFFSSQAENIQNKIPYEFNSIKFVFTTPSFVGGSKNEFSTYLEGDDVDQDWSEWSSMNTKTYERLGNGEYTFNVKSRNYYGQESKIAQFKFTILPPWYKTWWAYLLYFIGTVLLVYLIIKVSIRRVKEQNEKLEKIVEERTAEVEHQKHEIELKNKDIVDSIKYAKRIQNTILPAKERMDEILQDYFVIYKPKDIVSGDFYWADLLDGKSYFSAIDCTGHGVPGAFVSIVGFNGLKRTVNEFKVRQPGQILDTLTDIVVDTFTASESHLKDGMDLALCSLDYNTLELEYAGANNPLIIIRDNEIIEIKGNKQPIGEFDNRQPFTNHKVQLEKGDCIYLFSDGFADQFGGPKGKKFKLKNLKNLLLEISTLTPDQQQARLENAFYNWKGEIEQLDDVCVIGVKI
ncbi:MAG: SpoIIE family protein phosphatase [Putridiphycobacter sp.]